MRTIWKRLKSIKAAISFIAALAIGSVLSTLIPQGLERDLYYSAYPRILASLIVESGLDRYFSSLLFRLPAIAFFFNLLFCAADRFLRELKKKSGRRHGPDILHIGLLVLIAGALVSFSGRQEGSVELRPGDSVDLPNGERLILREFIDERYDDGRPKEWTSVVDVRRGETVVRSRARIRVNAPLRVGGTTLYQASYGAERGLELTDKIGTVKRLSKGDTASADGVDLFFMAVDEGAHALVRVAGLPGNTLARVAETPVEIGPFRAVLRTIPTTVLNAVSDPGYPIVVAGLLLVAAGTAATFINKLKESST